ncbi:MAG: hypothetical protein ABIN13_09890 [Mucilaginibacter sp.]
MKKYLLTIALPILFVTMFVTADKGKTKTTTTTKTTANTDQKSNTVTFGGGTTRTD